MTTAYQKILSLASDNFNYPSYYTINFLSTHYIHIVLHYAHYTAKFASKIKKKRPINGLTIDLERSRSNSATDSSGGGASLAELVTPHTTAAKTAHAPK